MTGPCVLQFEVETPHIFWCAHCSFRVDLLSPKSGTQSGENDKSPAEA
jgi:hypothetical protein